MHRGLAHSCAQSAGLPMLFTSVQANRAGQEKGWGQHGRRQRHHSRAMGPATLALPGFYRMICILAGWPEQLIASAGLSTLICETRTEKSLLRGLSRTLNDKVRVPIKDLAQGTQSRPLGTAPHLLPGVATPALGQSRALRLQYGERVMCSQGSENSSCPIREGGTKPRPDCIPGEPNLSALRRNRPMNPVSGYQLCLQSRDPARITGSFQRCPAPLPGGCLLQLSELELGQLSFSTVLGTELNPQPFLRQDRTKFPRLGSNL
ncbi:PREDICTED: uncharacterized protein LOC106149110 isoform X1 [Chinchilla lanigera]|uniref:uncharacterized protein LOC106149110 isoform X1 n=1 Tax=Chinchilla lanigera TaxID=34839 RepID=UPI000695EB1E|nr:PREDICTED: uncharacterized protein LOC106149110 isoform X1 [Chinchilla lanigera]